MMMYEMSNYHYHYHLFNEYKKDTLRQTYRLNNVLRKKEYPLTE